MQVGQATNWATVDAGYLYTCGTRSNATLWCWGWNASGQLGDGTVLRKTRPHRIGTDANWASVAASSSNHTCGTRTDHTAWCWGYNYYGEVGDGTNITRLSPVQVGTSSAWQSVDTGDNYTCGTRSNKTAWCWGYNYFGQFGDGTTDSRRVPGRVAGSTSWDSIAVGRVNTCGVAIDATLWCWGSVLGYVPAQVGSDAGWAMATQDETHKCATRLSGSLWCWGYNRNGQVGDGTRTDRSEPTRISVP